MGNRQAQQVQSFNDMEHARHERYRVGHAQWWQARAENMVPVQQEADLALSGGIIEHQPHYGRQVGEVIRPDFMPLEHGYRPPSYLMRQPLTHARGHPRLLSNPVAAIPYHIKRADASDLPGFGQPMDVVARVEGKL